MKKVLSLGVLLFSVLWTYAYQITFRVDMTNQTVSPNGVSMAGNFGDITPGQPTWTPGAIMLTDPDMNNIYEVTLNLNSGTYFYKFLNGNAWGTDEGSGLGSCNSGGNRTFTVGTSDQIRPVFCFNECSFCASNPQFHDVTFKVDMQNDVVSPNGVHLAGSFHFTPAPHTGPQWNPAGITMTDSNNDEVYEVTLTLAEGYYYEYKFINGNDWNAPSIPESVPGGCSNNTNRFVNVGTSDISLGEVCFASCSDCVPTPEEIDVTFRVDMQNQTVSPNGVHLAGSFGSDGYAQWNPSGIVMTDGNSDGVFEVTLTLTEGVYYEYKFINGTSFDFAEIITEGCQNGSGNRAFTAGAIDVTLNEVCFAQCVDCTPIYPVTFRVNLVGETVSPNGVYLAGSFGSSGYAQWQPNQIQMTDGNADGVYEVTLNLVSGITYQYKFINGNDWPFSEVVPSSCGADDGFGGFNRSILVDGIEDLSAICFGECANCILGCTNNTACNYNVSANTDDGSCTFASLTYYVDTDGDGFGAGMGALYCSNPGAGFSSNNTDCNDANATVYPNAPELCGDNLDNDCDGSINEGCPVTVVANDSRASAPTMMGVTFPLCSNTNGTLAGATPSPEAMTNAPMGAGQDVWYKFVAQNQGARIQVSSTVNNLVLELQDNAGTAMLFSENETTTGQEVLIANNLTPGQTYFVAVRNFNTSSVGNFTICIQHLRASVPNNGTTFSNLCAFIKASWTGAQLYSATFVNGQDSYTAGNTSTQIPFSLFNGLEYGTTYSVTFSNTFILPDAGGNNVTSVVTGAPFNVTIAAHPAVQLRAADRCPTTRARGSFISTDVVVCGATEYEWEFIEVDANDNVIGVETILVESNSTSRYLRVSQIPGVQDGDRYRVRIRPVFSYGPGAFTSGYQLLCVAGQAPINAPILEEGDVFAPSAATAAERAFEVYPNPNAGDVFNVRLAGINSEVVIVRMLDAMGRVVYNNQFTLAGSLNTSIVMEEKLSSGMYMIQVIDGEETMNNRMIIR